MTSTNNTQLIIEMFRLTNSLAEKQRFSNEQELMTYQKGLEFAEAYFLANKVELDRLFKNDDTSEGLSGT